MLEQDNSHDDQSESHVVTRLFQAFSQQNIGGNALHQARKTVPHSVDLHHSLTIPQAANQELNHTHVTRNTLDQVIPSRLLGLELQIEVTLDLHEGKQKNVREVAHYPEPS